MEMFKESEIMRLNLDTVVLRLLSLGFKDVENFDFI
jgi:HrpA-like RNA helicase